MDGLKMKQPLQFTEEGVFRVLMLSDIQESVNYDERSLKSVCALLDEAKPNLVIWGGDNCFGPEMHSLEDVKAFLDVFAAPMEERGIPWGHVFGNHDHDVPGDIRLHQALYEASPMHVSGHTDETVSGVTNFLLPIYDHNGQRPVFHVWGLDSNNILHVGRYSAEQIRARDIQYGVCFGPALVVNGEAVGRGGGVNPRTAIGQRSDGAILMLVIEGRQVTSLGATYDDLAEIMLTYGAVNACNLDGGSSTMMWYNGEYLNKCAAVSGERPIPTTFVVLKEGDGNE